MKHIYDPAFKYVKAHETDIRKTFARIKRDQEKAQEARRVAAQTKPAPNVSAIRARGAKA